jgi:hypothetical protein
MFKLFSDIYFVVYKLYYVGQNDNLDIRVSLKNWDRESSSSNPSHMYTCISRYELDASIQPFILSFFHSPAVALDRLDHVSAAATFYYSFASDKPHVLSSPFVWPGTKIAYLRCPYIHFSLIMLISIKGYLAKVLQNLKWRTLILDITDKKTGRNYNSYDV